MDFKTWVFKKLVNLLFSIQPKLLSVRFNWGHSYTGWTKDDARNDRWIPRFVHWVLLFLTKRRHHGN